MQIYRIPRREVLVRVALDDGSKLEGILYTATAAPSGAPESVMERLNRADEEFVPLAQGEERFLLNKAGIILVEIPGGAGEIPDADAPVGHDVTVHVTLVGGGALAGRMRIVMPPERSRLLDYLNAAPSFLPILREDGVTLVHKRFVVAVHGEGD